MRKLYINDLAEAAGLDVARTKFLRHQERNDDTGETSWSIWLRSQQEFDVHQSLYDTQKPIGDSLHIVSLIAAPGGLTVFLGV